MKMKLLAIADGSVIFHGDFYLKGFDPEAFDGYGSFDITGNPDEAMQFNTVSEALEVWKTVSRTRPVRDDGKPNRPLTAFTIEVVP